MTGEHAFPALATPEASDGHHFDRLPGGGYALVLDQPGNIVTAAFSPMGDRVATGGRDGLAMIWELRNGGRLHELQHRGNVLDVAWSPNGGLLATASTDNGGRIFRTDTGTLLTFLGAHSNQVVGFGWPFHQDQVRLQLSQRAGQCPRRARPVVADAEEMNAQSASRAAR